MQLCTTHPASDTAKRLSWLQASVAPVIRRLLDAGYAGPALAALGFDEAVCIVGAEVHRQGADRHNWDLN